MKELVATQRIADVADVAQAEAGDGAERVVDQEHVEVPVVVVVEERRLGGVAFVGEAVLLCHLLERGNAVLVEALIDVQLVRASLAGDVPRIADVDVEQPIPVHIGEGDTRRPAVFLSAHSCLVGDVLELEAALVQVEMIPVLIRSQHHLRQSISVEIADRDATAVVEIAVGKDVHLWRILDAILEMQPGVARWQQGEEMIVYWRFWSLTAGNFLLLLIAGTGGGEIQRGKEIAKPQPQGRVHRLVTTLAHHGLLSEENRP